MSIHAQLALCWASGRLRRSAGHRGRSSRVQRDTGPLMRRTRFCGGYLGQMSATKTVRVARVYADAGPDDGRRFLVDRIWPRGVRKDDPRVGTWLKDVAPAKELRGCA